MPIAVIIAVIQGIIAAAPNIANAAKSIKEFIDTMSASKVITAVQQDALHKYVDSLQALALAGIKPPAWEVEPDPQP